MNFKTLLKYALHAAVLAGLILAAVKYLNGREFWLAIHRFDWVYAPFVCLLALGAIVVKAWRFSTLMKKTSRAQRTMTMNAYVAGQAMTLIPGGIAARSALLEQVEIPSSESSAAVAMSSLSDQLGFIFCTIVCAFWFEQARKPLLIVLGFLALISIVLGVEASRTWLIGIIERILKRFNLQESWRNFLESMKKTVKPKAVLLGLVNTLVAFALLVTALHLCVRGVDAKMAFLPLVLAFSLPTMLGRISALPGGLGVTEFGMASIINAAPGVTLNQAAAAVVIFRLGTVLFTAFVGGLVYLLVWRRTVKKETGQGSAKAPA